MRSNKKVQFWASCHRCNKWRLLEEKWDCDDDFECCDVDRCCDDPEDTEQSRPATRSDDQRRFWRAAVEWAERVAKPAPAIASDAVYHFEGLIAEAEHFPPYFPEVLAQVSD